MYSIESLYKDKDYETLLKMLSRKASLTEDYEDFKQEVFVELCEYECSGRREADTIAKRVAQRLYRERQLLFDEMGNKLDYSYDDDRDFWREDIDGRCRSVLWEDNHRL